MPLDEKIKIIKKRLEQFAKSPRGKRILKLLRGLFLFIILSWLGYNLYQVGWQAVWQNLPMNPLFYLIFFLIYVSAPTADILIYRYTWNFDVGKNIDAFFKKRILNTDVVGYSGEFYFFSWARKHIPLSDMRIGETIRDYNIISSLASTTRTLVFLIVFAIIAKEEFVELAGAADPMYLILGGLALLVLAPIVVRFRKYIFVTPFKIAKVVYGIYFTRLALGTILQILMWSVVIADVSLGTWILYSAVSILVSWIPIPNKKLVFVGVGTEMSTGLGIPKEAMLGLLLSVAALEKILNFAFYLLVTVVPVWQDDELEKASADLEKQQAGEHVDTAS